MSKRINSSRSNLSKHNSRPKKSGPPRQRTPHGCASLPWSTEVLVSQYLRNLKRREEYRNRHLEHHAQYNSYRPWPLTRYQEDFQRYPTDLVMEAYYSNLAAYHRNRRRGMEDHLSEDHLPPKGWYPFTSTLKGQRHHLSRDEEIVLTIDDLLEVIEGHQDHKCPIIDALFKVFKRRRE